MGIGSANSSRDRLVRLLRDHFPTAGIDHAFAYGSGVFTQPGLYTDTSDGRTPPMIDLLFAVRDPVAWHGRNLSMNPTHYAFPMSMFGPSAINWASRFIGSGVYFNPMVPLIGCPGGKQGTQTIKYGVMATDDAERDLIEWNSLYVAGRMHKVVETLIEDERIVKAQAQNLTSAVRTALLLLDNGAGSTYSIQDLLRIICSLSYMGDIRVGIAEDANKVHRIVEGSKSRLFQLYKPALEREVDHGTMSMVGDTAGGLHDGSHFQFRDMHVDNLLASLPIALRHRIRGSGQAALRRALALTVRRSSARQAALGLLSAGPAKAATYLLEKVKKALV